MVHSLHPRSSTTLSPLYSNTQNGHTNQQSDHDSLARLCKINKTYDLCTIQSYVTQVSEHVHVGHTVDQESFDINSVVHVNIGRAGL